MENLDHILKNPYENTQFHGQIVSLLIVKYDFRRNLRINTKMFYVYLIHF